MVRPRQVFQYSYYEKRNCKIAPDTQSTWSRSARLVRPPVAEARRLAERRPPPLAVVVPGARGSGPMAKRQSLQSPGVTRASVNCLVAFFCLLHVSRRDTTASCHARNGPVIPPRVALRLDIPRHGNADRGETLVLPAGVRRAPIGIRKHSAAFCARAECLESTAGYFGRRGTLDRRYQPLFRCLSGANLLLSAGRHGLRYDGHVSNVPVPGHGARRVLLRRAWDGLS